jgi:hypothetical protein
MNAAAASLVLAITLACTASAQLFEDLPSTRPSNCNSNTYEGCTPFSPPRFPLTNGPPPCGEDDVYFPTPLVVVRNDTSSTGKLSGVQWACVACATVRCGFDDSGAACAHRNYDVGPRENYGCTKCSLGYVKLAATTGVKTNYEDFSTGYTYSVVTTPFTGGRRRRRPRPAAAAAALAAAALTRARRPPAPAECVLKSEVPVVKSPAPTPAAAPVSPAAVPAAQPSPAAAAPSPAAAAPSPAAVNAPAPVPEAAAPAPAPAPQPEEESPSPSPVAVVVVATPSPAPSGAAAAPARWAAAAAAAAALAAALA